MFHKTDSNENIDFVRSKVEKLLEQVGFIETIVYFICKLPDGTENEKVYRYNELHCKITFLTRKNTLGILKNWILFEYANNLHDAQWHMYDDGDMIPLDVGIDIILLELENELRKEIVDRT